MIRITGLVKKTGGEKILDGVELETARGEVVIITGATAEKRRVLLRCIDKLEIPDSGDVMIENISIRDPRLSTKRLRLKAGMVPPPPSLFTNMTALENISVGQSALEGKSRQEAKKTSLAMLEANGLAAIADRYPAELDSGDRRIVSILRTLALEPPVMLFDSPAAGLDGYNAKRVFDLISTIAGKGNRTLLISMDDPEPLKEIADRIMKLENGRLVQL